MKIGLVLEGGANRGVFTAGALDFLLEQGVTRDALERFDRELIAQNASPGGSADLLALCWLLHFLQETVA